MAGYAPINPAPQTWATAEAASYSVIWQVRSGTLLLTTGDTPSDDAAILLSAPQALAIGPGYAVHYRAVSAGTHVSRNAA